MLHARKRILRIEALEDRSMMAVAFLASGTLNIIGTRANDNIQVSMQGSDIRVDANGTISTYTADRIRILGQDGNDTLTVDANVIKPVRIEGGRGNDIIQGGSGNDILLGGAGDDTIVGGSGTDRIFGGNGSDNIDAGQSNDQVIGGKGNDVIHGGDGEDELFGGAGNDEIYGEHDSDICDGGAGDDRVEGGDLNDQLFGGAGVDLLLGGNDDDFLDGGAGDDTCQGGSGTDKIKGGLGNDIVDGQAGNNLVDGDAGTNTVSNGIEVDLDRESMAYFHSGHGPVNELIATFTLSNENGSLAARFAIDKYYDALPNGSHDIVIGGENIGQIQVSSTFASVTYTTNPVGNERPFPVNFPEVGPGVKAQIGSVNLSKFKSIHANAPRVPKAPKSFT